MAKKKMVMAIDEEIGEKFRSTLIENGWPRSAAGVSVQNFMEKVLSEVEKNGFSPDLFFFSGDK